MTKDSLNPSPLGIPPIQIGREPLLVVSRARGCRLLILKRVFTQCFPGARHSP